ncbi:Z1 domain-containing protein [Dietzia kunjamensis]|uniref:Z1 domain-containing protein n=1 Tax=Dietzia kunjamensis TaxID=322509 RepID=UPI0022B40803|nr:Z1 domain-containing protein [Dietzia kunjamensis]MCZ4654578.1 Z1 domain-containing protein [Dietzia kunjamensis]
MAFAVADYDIEEYQEQVDLGRAPDQIVKRLVSRGRTEEQVARIRAAFEISAGKIRKMESVGVISARTDKTGTWYSGVQPFDVAWPKLRVRLEQSLPAEAVKSIDESSDRVLAELGAPVIPGRELRGLVLGFVQSGKTTNFMSVIAKAADRGYRFFIVLSGITENLRSQTQERVDEMLVEDNKQFVPLTSVDADFEAPEQLSKIVSQQDLRLIAVVKKNPHRLRRLLAWLKSAQRDADQFPILIIDDEADQASVDVGQGRASRINSLIREILDFERAGYVAYTATPFANVLIDPTNENDLFPKDFIVDLPKPDNYFGSAEMFGRGLLETDESQPSSGLDVIRSIPESHVEGVRQPRGKGAVESWDPSVPSSLLTALRWFVLSTAARRVRGTGNKHSSMLIHTSMLGRAHEKLAAVVEKALEEEDASFHAGTTVGELRELWNSESRVIDPADYGNAGISFDELVGELESVFSDLRLVIDNYRSTDRLHYGETPQVVVVIGGNTLSRGLTLEGLIVSYFVRASNAYDSLLQMGRWFGYRIGYEDLQRVWMTDELNEFFFDLATVEEEFRQFVQQYEHETTPAEVRPVIRTHPTMLVAARNKTRAAHTVWVSLSQEVLQTILFKHRDRKWLERNRRAAATLLSSAVAAVGEPQPSVMAASAQLLRDVSVETVLRFLDDYQFHPAATRTKGDLIRKYIEKQNKGGALTKWNIAVMSKSSSAKSPVEVAPEWVVKPVERSRMKHQVGDHANIRTLIGSMDRLVDLEVTASERQQILTTKLTTAEKNKMRERWATDRGLLLIYPIARDSSPKLDYADAKSEAQKTGLDAVDDVIGVAFQFPRAHDLGAAVEYISVPPPAEEFEVDDVDDLDSMDEEA